MRMLFLIPIFIAAASAADNIIPPDSCLSKNTDGCSLGRAPRYLIMAPDRLRPDQIYQVFVTILRLEYGQRAISVHASIIRNNNEYATTAVRVDRPSSRILQMKMPATAEPGDYRLQIKGNVEGMSSGYIFLSEKKIEFSSKKVSIFIQMSKPIYRQQQMVHFRVIPVKPDLMPQYGTAVVYVEDPTGFPVERWQAIQTNAGGILSKSFQLSDQPNYGTWHIRVEAFGHSYRHPFIVEEFWMPRFDVNVTAPTYVINDDNLVIKGVMVANHTSGRPCKGNGSVTAYFRPTEEHWNATKGWEKPYHDAIQAGKSVPIDLPLYRPSKDIHVKDFHLYFPSEYRFIEYYQGKIEFQWTAQEIKAIAEKDGSSSIVNGEVVFFFNIVDWYSSLNRTGWAGTYILNKEVNLKWIGGAVRSFKPGSKIKVQLAVYRADGTPVNDGSIVQTTQTVDHQSTQTQNQNVVNGIVEVELNPGLNAKRFLVKASYFGTDPAQKNSIKTNSIDMWGSRYYSPTDSYISVYTSTLNPQANEYMIFHVLTTEFVSRIYYQIISKGNIIDGDELEMTSRQKTFSLALSRKMVPNARILVYYVRLPEEIVADVLHFFVNGTNHNQVRLEANKGKDFTLDTMELNAYADPGSYLATSGILLDFYERGLSDGITENKLIDELMSFDGSRKGTYRHLWRVSGTDYKYSFFHGTDYGVDGKTSLENAGLVVLTDIDIKTLPNVATCNSTHDLYPCFSGLENICYKKEQKCNGLYDGCPNDGADEFGCETDDILDMTYPMDRISRIMRFYDNSSWAWQEIFVKPNGRVDFRVDVPKYPLTWMINAISMSQELGLGIMPRPLRYDTSRYMYIQVEHPEHIVMGEQIGIRVTVFNYWYEDDYLEVLITLHAGDDVSFVVVAAYGIVSSYAPKTHKGEHQTIVFLEPGESKDIYLPIVPDKNLDMAKGIMNFHVTASSFCNDDEYYGTMKVQSNGVLNYFHTPYKIDLIKEPSRLIPYLQVDVQETYRKTYLRENIYVPGSASAKTTFFGDVVVPGFFEDYLNAENILYRPYGGGEMATFNFAYNLLSLRFMRHSNQLGDKILITALREMKIALQRVFSYMVKYDDDQIVSFKMFRDDPHPSLWLTAFVGKTLSEAIIGERFERELYIPTDLIDKIIFYICSRQNETTGAFTPLPEESVFDRKMASLEESASNVMYSDEIPLTAYIIIALNAMSKSAQSSQGCLKTTQSRAGSFLAEKGQAITSNEVFFMAITTYALSLTDSDLDFESKLIAMQINRTYFADSIVYPNKQTAQDNMWYRYPRQEFMNEGYAVQSTAYALLALLPSDKLSMESKVQMMSWINTMRNSVGGFASTQDTIVAMEALFEYTNKDPNRDEFLLSVSLEASSVKNWYQEMTLTKSDYVRLEQRLLPRKYTWGYIISGASGVGRGMLQLTTTVRVEEITHMKKQMHYDNDPNKPLIQFFSIDSLPVKWSGRNSSIIEMTNCVSWVFTQRSLTSGLSVLEVDIPTGYVVMNDTLRDYVRSGVVQNLRRAESYGRKVVFYFDHLDQSKTCVYFRADRWYPVANSTKEYRIRVFDYYEPGMHQTQLYKTEGLNRLSICLVCGSYQCPYCPYFNTAAIKTFEIGMMLFNLALFFLVRLFIHRDSIG